MTRPAVNLWKNVARELSPFSSDETGTVPFPAAQGKVKTPVPCRLCGETIEVLSDFRATAVDCPRCGLRFTFDPQRSPLPVQGLRLRFADVVDRECRSLPAAQPAAAPPAQRPQPSCGRRRLRLLTGLLLPLLIAVVLLTGILHYGWLR
ncbi:MAG: hypothetical protein ABSF26_19620 [Thermoguttaceae bacterium]|jgi:hypothetical protein